jgi:hypothetical protein
VVGGLCFACSDNFMLTECTPPTPPATLVPIFGGDGLKCYALHMHGHHNRGTDGTLFTPPDRVCEPGVSVGHATYSGRSMWTGLLLSLNPTVPSEHVTNSCV